MTALSGSGCPAFGASKRGPGRAGVLKKKMKYKKKRKKKKEEKTFPRRLFIDEEKTI